MLILLSLVSTGGYSFVVITNSNCEPCNEKVMVVQDYFHAYPFTVYELTESETRIRFEEIREILGEVYLPMPLFGCFKDDRLIALVAGGQTHEDLEAILQAQRNGATLYVENMFGRAEYVKTIDDMDAIARLEYLFITKRVAGGPLYFKELIMPVIVAAVIDAVNPCVIGVLLVMLTFVFYGVERNIVFKIGSAFCLAVFITYFLIGLGLLQIFSQIIYIKYVTIIFAILLGSLRITEFFIGESKHLPETFITKITERLEKASDPRTAFVAGVVTATLILPCSSAPYFLALNLISENATLIEGIILLLCYNLIIVTPLLLITVLIHFIGVQTMALKIFISEKKKWINLIFGIVLVALGLFVLFI
jgi:cytochrome c-type biogenesis protein